MSVPNSVQLRGIPWGRCIAAIIAAVIFIVGINALVSWWQMRARCADAETTELAVFPGAFGSNGIYKADFNPKYAFTCREMLLVEHATAAHSREDVMATLDGLNADLVISDGNGNAVIHEKMTKDDFLPHWEGEETNHCLPAFMFRPVTPGYYQIRLMVHTPAQGLSNVPHRVVARYVLCGIEYIGAAFDGFISLLAFIVSSIITIGIIMVTRKKKKHYGLAL